MTGSRLRGTLLAATAAAAALLLLAWSQSWHHIVLSNTPDVEGAALDVGGDVAAGGLAPLALTTLVMVAALAIAGPVFRRILGVLESLVGASIIATTLVTISDPVHASAPAITEATGISGRDSIDDFVFTHSSTAWPWIAVALGVAIITIGIVVTATAGRWPTSGRKYTRTRVVTADDAPADPVAEWDALSDGDDPTAPAR